MAPDIVVQGMADRKAGDWKRAESEHAIIYGQNSADELTQLSKNVERLYTLMARLYRRGQAADDTIKPVIVLVDTAEHYRAMGLQNTRSEEGPYRAPFAGERYYDPRADGELIAVPRVDLYLDLNTNRADNADCDDKQAADASDGDAGSGLCGASSIYHPPAIRTWQQNVYSAFAEHFMLTYHPAPYPRWYIDGIGALFSTIAAHDGGGVDYGLPPDQLRQIFRAYGNPPVIDILAGRAPSGDAKASAWTPYHAWLMAYYFAYGDARTVRRAQFDRYMAAITGGETQEEAAKAFANPVALQREVMGDVLHEMPYAHGAKPAADVTPPVLTPVSEAAAALIETRLAQTPFDAPTNGGRSTRDEVDALAYAAQNACHDGRNADCLAAAERALAIEPDNVAALSWKGSALVRQAAIAPAATKAARLDAARGVIQRAITLDPRAPLPRIAYFESFTRVFETAPDDAIAGMGQAIRAVPAAPAPRLALAEELLRQGKTDLARRVSFSVVHAPYDSPERRTAEALFPPAAAQAVTGATKPAG